MTDRQAASGRMEPEQEPPGRDRRLLNAGAIVTEVVVLLALWLLGRTFGS